MLTVELPKEVPKRLIVSDTCASKALDGVPSIPLHIIWPDGEDQLDSEFSKKPEDFYSKMHYFMDKGLGLPTTAQPSVAEFSGLYTELYRRGAREVGSVHIMSTKSGTFGNAVLAAGEVMKEHPDMNILPMDSQAVSLAQFFQVETAVKELDGGASLDEINKILLKNAQHNMSLDIAISSVKNLAASGRVSGVKATFAAILNMTIIVHLSDNDLNDHAHIRGIKPGRNRIVEMLKREIVIRKALPSQVGVIYTRDPEIGEDLKVSVGDILREPGVNFAGSAEAGSLLGIHAGPGAAALAALW